MERSELKEQLSKADGMEKKGCLLWNEIHAALEGPPAHNPFNLKKKAAQPSKFIHFSSRAAGERKVELNLLGLPPREARWVAVCWLMC